MTEEKSSRFYKWLSQQKSRDDVVGDIATDVCRDLGFPKSISSKKEFLAYIALKTSDQSVRDAAEEAYAEYRQNK